MLLIALSRHAAICYLIIKRALLNDVAFLGAANHRFQYKGYSSSMEVLIYPYLNLKNVFYKMFSSFVVLSAIDLNIKIATGMAVSFTPWSRGKMSTALYFYYKIRRWFDPQWEGRRLFGQCMGSYIFSAIIPVYKTNND